MLNYCNMFNRINMCKFFLKRCKRFAVIVLNEVADLKLKKTGYIYKSEKINSIFYLPFVKTDLIQNIIYKSGQYFEWMSLCFVCKQWREGVVGRRIADTLVLDIGANIGNHTLYYVNECNAKHVYCFEPIKDTFEVLKRNIEINNISKRVDLFNFAVGDGIGKATISHYDTDNIGGTSIELDDMGNIEVKSIDGLDINETIGLVKIDVEGFEISVIKGMMNTLKRHRPFITIEINDNNYNEACLLLERIGYKHILLNKVDNYGDFLFYYEE